jgi:hypothetical protein
MVAICKANGGQTSVELVSETRMRSVKPNQDGPLDGTSCGTELHDFGFESPGRTQVFAFIWLQPERFLDFTITTIK